ncbi:MAG: hypothetical protein QM695_14360 [Micropruina sp.]
MAIADPSSSPSPKPAAGLLNESDAMRQAKESGKPVEVSALTDERTLVTADPGTGLFSAELTAGVARVRDAKGGWREPLTKLVQGEDGLWRPEATVAQIVVSNGGAREPLVSLADGEARVSLGWPEKLPEPVVEGATATYREVLSGVDLVARADVESVETYLVVKSREAAKNPRVRKAAFGWSAPGLTVKSVGNGSRSLLDGKGVERLVLPPARMWDSSGARKNRVRAEEIVAEAAEAKVADVGLKVAEGTLTASVVGSLLDDPATVYPVIIDPSVSASQTYVVRTTETFNTINDMSVDGKIGYNGWTSPYYKSRMFYQFKWPLYNGVVIGSEQVVSSQFEYVQKHSPQNDCSDNSYGPAVRLDFTGVIDSSTTWGGPAPHSKVTSVTNDYAVGNEAKNCGTYRQKWNVTQMAQQELANYDRTTVTVRVSSSDESDKKGWRHYQNASGSSPKLVVNYQQAPLAPTNVKAWPLTAGGKVLSPVPLLSGTMRLPS